MPRVCDSVGVSWLHADQRQHEDGAGCVKGKQLSPSVRAEAQKAGRIDLDLKALVVSLDVVRVPKRKVAGQSFRKFFGYTFSFDVGDIVNWKSDAHMCDNIKLNDPAHGAAAAWSSEKRRSGSLQRMLGLSV